MQKYIHYCWFGNKKMPKLAYKCIKSWQKYLPDYKIIKWSEENVDLDECPFIREAYDNKKWAFVADYARTKALKEYGGIYFDTDMEVIKNIDSLFKNNTFLGLEDSGYVAVGVWYEKEKNALLPTELLKKYNEIKKFDVKSMSEYSIPKLLSSILNRFKFRYNSNEIQVLDNDICIYPREYFYPYSYDRQDNIFTDNTCMIHYYDASWIPFKDRFENNLVRRLGKKNAYRIINVCRKLKMLLVKLIKIILFPVVLYRRYKKRKSIYSGKYLDRLNKTVDTIKKYNSKEYIAFHNDEWLGVTSATIELFDNCVPSGEYYRKKDIKLVGETILQNNIKQVIFSSFAIGWKDLIIYIKKKNPNTKIKTFWHGNHSQILDSYGWQRNLEIIHLHKSGYIDVMATCKKSLIDFYKNEGYNSYFLTNKVDTNVKCIKKKSDEITIGLYAAKCSDWRKNMYSQMAAVSLIENAVIDMVPLNDDAIKFAKTIGVKIKGEKKSLSREKLLERLSKNDVNLYVTFSECAPMLPLESFEMGVPCLTGNNHHYFNDFNIKDNIVVCNEESVIDIKNKIVNCIENKDKIMKMYKEFKKFNDTDSKRRVKEFIEM